MLYTVHVPETVYRTFTVEIDAQSPQEALEKAYHDLRADPRHLEPLLGHWAAAPVDDPDNLYCPFDEEPPY